MSRVATRIARQQIAVRVFPFPDLASASIARRWARQQAARWDLECLTGDLELITSELIANAVIHGAAPVTIRLRRCNPDPAIVIEVSDSGMWRPRATGEPDVEHGRGLAVVTTLATVFGARPRTLTGGAGKTIWAVVSAPRRPGVPRPRTAVSQPAQCPAGTVDHQEEPDG